MELQIYKRHVPDYVKKQLPILFDGTPDFLMYEKGKTDHCVMVFREGEKVIGAINYSVYDVAMIHGMPYCNIYIDRFEVCEKQLRKGYGTQMFAMFRAYLDPNVYEYTLTHRSYDDGASYKFWRRQGFRHQRLSECCMYLKIKQLI